MHLILSYNLLNEYVLELVNNFGVVTFLCSFRMNINRLVLRREILSEHVVSDSLAGLEAGSYDLRPVVDVGEYEFYDLRGLRVQMIIFTRILSNLLKWVLKLTNIAACSICVLM